MPTYDHDVDKEDEAAPDMSLVTLPDISTADPDDIKRDGLRNMVHAIRRLGLCPATEPRWTSGFLKNTFLPSGTAVDLIIAGRHRHAQSWATC